MHLKTSVVFSTLAAAALLPLGTAQAAGVSGQGTWETTLLPRDINGDNIVDAFYDTVLDVSWLANANANGPMNWATATAWAAGLDVYGKTGWRLPTMIDTGAPVATSATPAAPTAATTCRPFRPTARLSSASWRTCGT